MEKLIDRSLVKLHRRFEVTLLMLKEMLAWRLWVRLVAWLTPSQALQSQPADVCNSLLMAFGVVNIELIYAAIISIAG